MRYVICDYHHNEMAIDLALRDADHKRVEFGEPADVMLIDYEGDTLGYWNFINRYAPNTPVVVYPHGANPIYGADGIHVPHPHISGMLEVATGHALVKRSFGYRKPTCIMGWPFSPIKEFQKKRKIEKILFCALHPDGRGHLPQKEKEINNRVFRELTKTRYDITIRYLFTPDANGIGTNSQFKYHRDANYPAIEDIENADLVIATGSIAYLSVALGKPTIMFADFPDSEGPQPLHWNHYAAFMRYPIMFEDRPLKDNIQLARTNYDIIGDWKRFFIGKPFNGPRVVRFLERIVNGKTSNS